MHLHKSILLFTDNINQFSYLNSFCAENEIKLSHLTNLAELIEDVFHTRYDVLVIDDRLFPTSSNLLSIFSKHIFYVPNVIVKTRQKLDCNCITCYRSEDIIYNLKNIFNNKEYVQPFIADINHYTKVIDIVNHLGINSKYKGYKYLIDILDRMLTNGFTSVSFKKYVYPYVASLYSVSEDSVERDVRNILLKAINTKKFKDAINFDEQNFGFTTRNIINCLLIYIKKNLYNSLYSRLSS